MPLPSEELAAKQEIMTMLVEETAPRPFHVNFRKFTSNEKRHHDANHRKTLPDGGIQIHITSVEHCLSWLENPG
jgi:hypothetical protein